MGAINIDAVVDSRRFGAFQLGVAGLCMLVQIVDGFDGQAMAFAAPVLRKALHVSPAALGSVLSASSAGTLLGCLFAGSLADRFGRKPVMVGGIALAALLMALTAHAGSVSELMLLRFLNGLPLGALLPVTTVLASEWTPRTKRATVVIILGSGYATGAAVGGLIVSFLLPVYGWPSVFYAGAIGTGLICLILLPLLPESLQFLNLRAIPADARVSNLMRRFDPDRNLAALPTVDLPRRLGGWATIAALFRDGHASTTVLLWACSFLNMVVLAFITHWLPTVLNISGLAVGSAVRTATLNYASGVVGTFVLGAIAARLGVWRLGTIVYFAAALVVAATGAFSGSPMLAVMIILLGLSVVGLRHVIIAMAMAAYPADLRSAGSGWLFALTHVGSILGPLAGGLLFGWGLGVTQVFWAMGLISLSGAMLMVLLARNERHRPASPHLGAELGASSP